MNCLFVNGAWISVYAILYLFKTELNKEFNAGVYKLTAESSLSVYVTHSFFDNLFLSWFIVPFKHEEEAKGGFAFLISLFANIVFTEIVCIGLYLGYCKIENRLKGN